jgi:hypothetical protein
MPAVSSTASRPGGTGLRLRRALRERRRLPFARAARRSQFPCQALVLALQALATAFRLLKLPTQSIDLSIQIRQRRGLLRLRRIGVIAHAPLKPESPRLYKRDPLTNYAGTYFSDPDVALAVGCAERAPRQPAPACRIHGRLHAGARQFDTRGAALRSRLNRTHTCALGVRALMPGA